MNGPLICPICQYPLTDPVIRCPSCKENLEVVRFLQWQPKILFNRGLQAVQSGAYEEAIASLRQSTALDPTFLEAWVLLGKVYYQAQHFEDAHAIWKQVLSLDPDNAVAQGAIGVATQGVSTPLLSGTVLGAPSPQVPARRSFSGWYVLGSGVLLLIMLVWLVPTLVRDRGTNTLQAAATVAGMAQVAPTITSATLDGSLSSGDRAQPVLVTVIVEVTPIPELDAVTNPSATVIATLEPSASQAPPVPSTPAPVPDLVPSIIAALQSDPTLQAMPISVEQIGESVRVIGKVPTIALRYTVEQVVRAVPGVTLVDTAGLTLYDSYIVQSNDTLWKIAATIYERPERWRDIAAVNFLTAPYILHAGQVLIVPP